MIQKMRWLAADIPGATMALVGQPRLNQQCEVVVSVSVLYSDGTIKAGDVRADRILYATGEALEAMLGGGIKVDPQPDAGGRR